MPAENESTQEGSNQDTYDDISIEVHRQQHYLMDS
jgi:hypothetical protein